MVFMVIKHFLNNLLWQGEDEFHQGSLLDFWAAGAHHMYVVHEEILCLGARVVHEEDRQRL